jgi:hypothetical protein
MANKNTKQLRKQARKAGKSGQNEFAIQVATHGYHSSSNGEFKTRRIPTAQKGKDNVISINPRRNTQMRIFQNEGGGTLTVHEATDKSRPVVHKGHSYLISDEHENNQYAQPKNIKY